MTDLKFPVDELLETWAFYASMYTLGLSFEQALIKARESYEAGHTLHIGLLGSFKLEDEE